MTKVAILGTGTVGDTLADGLLKHGYEVKRGSRDPGKLADWKARAPAGAEIGTFAEAAAWAELVILAVKGTAAEQVVTSCGDALANKIVLDATNPIADAPPVNGVLSFFTGPNESLMEKLQAIAPAAKFVKCFNCVGAHFMIDPPFASKPTMFICGSDDGAKQATTALLDKVGWDTADMGALEAARAIESLCQLWCIPGLRAGSWTHAFKLLQLA